MIKIKNKIDIIFINDELTSSFDHDSLRAIVNVINILN